MLVVFLIVSVCTILYSTPASAHHLERINPKLANYYLGELNRDPKFFSELERYDVLILTPAQIQEFNDVVTELKEHHAGVTILAYVPSQSYNERYWPDDNIFRNLPTNSAWWLRDSHGAIVSTWPGLYTMNMSAAWSESLVNFTSNHIANLPGVDGIFFDIVSDNISWANNGDIDVDGNGVRDTAASADALWKSRVVYFLQYAKAHLGNKYIIINGSSNPAFQPYVNGRMFETFPTPWEGDGTWTTVMNNLVANKQANGPLPLTIINGNTLNTGEQNNFTAVRYGVASSLLEDDVYYSFDFGDQNHGQLWWYDEYSIDLGPAKTSPLAYAAPTKTFAERSTFAPGVWRRDFTRGISLVNSTRTAMAVELNGDYEKIHGVQDKRVNDGSIVSETTLGADDGLLLLKTFTTIDDILFTNGYFGRFFRPDGTRLRNGTFISDDAYRGGVQIDHTDVNGDGRRDTVLVTQNSLTVYRDDGQLFLQEYPYGVNYTGGLSVAVRDITGDGKAELVVAPAVTTAKAQPVKIYSYDGSVITSTWYPFGKYYRQGLRVTVGVIDNGAPKIIFGSAPGEVALVSEFDGRTYKFIRRFYPYETWYRGGVSVAAGDINGDGIDELVTGPGRAHVPLVRVWNATTRRITSSFTAYKSTVYSGISVGVNDVDFDGKKDVVVWTSSVGL